MSCLLLGGLDTQNGLVLENDLTAIADLPSASAGVDIVAFTVNLREGLKTMIEFCEKLASGEVSVGHFAPLADA